LTGRVEGAPVGAYDCLGPSMRPTLRAGDALWVVPYDGNRIRRGDVIVFCPPPGAEPEVGPHVVHRVVSTEAPGIRTRGDNNRGPDPWVLRVDDVLGRVAAVRKGSKWVRVQGGLWGTAWARTLAVLRGLDRGASRVLHPAYRWLARAGVLCAWLPQRLRPQVLSFERPGGVERLLLLGGRVIGRRPPAADQWQIRRPFRLFVDESSLPEEVVVSKACQESPCQQ
jgi:signal peptidase I